MQNEMQIIYKQLDELREYENNPRHNENAVAAVAASIEKFGWKQPIVIDAAGVIVCGHTRYKAAQRLGMQAAPCVIADDLTDEQIRAYRLADNKTAELAGWDFDKLDAELEALAETGFDMEAFGFDAFEMDDPQEVVEDEAPEVDEESEPRCKLGDIWQLGRHRLMCGDSTDKNTVDKLLDGATVDMIFTDPPYNVAFNGRSGKFDVIKNDDMEDVDFDKFIALVCDTIKYVKPANYYIWCNWKFYSTLQTKLAFKSCIVWAKNVFGLGKGYRHQHEFCLFNGEIDEAIKNESDLWEVAKDVNYVHPTQKPVALCGRALKNHKAAQNVLDLFGGSGSTLIACEQLDRMCYMMELDPKYCDVIVKRWETLTGEKAVLAHE